MVNIEQSNLATIYLAVRPDSANSTTVFRCRSGNIVYVYDISYCNTTISLNKDDPLFYNLITAWYVAVLVNHSSSQYTRGPLCVFPLRCSVSWVASLFCRGSVYLFVNKLHLIGKLFCSECLILHFTYARSNVSRLKASDTSAINNWILLENYLSKIILKSRSGPMNSPLGLIDAAVHRASTLASVKKS